MNELQASIEEQLCQLDEIYVVAQNIIDDSPEGTVRVSQKPTPEFYWVNDKTNNQGEYIRKANKKLVEQLVQKDYAVKVCQAIDEIKQGLEYKNAVDKLDEVIKYHEKLIPARRQLVEPFWWSDDEYVNLWETKQRLVCEKVKLEKHKQGDNVNSYWGGADKYPVNEDNGIITERGELVRSKSEKILADKFFMMGVPYIYESSLYLNGLGYVNPDFIVLNKRTRQEFYWEHFGMMDNPAYSEKTVRKLAFYENNHIYLGKQLIITCETSTQVLNTKRLEGLIKEFLL